MSLAYPITFLRALDFNLLEQFQEGRCQSKQNNFELALSIIVIAGIALSYIPQHVRIIRKRNSEGFSPWFLLLGSLSTCWSFLNVLIMQWKNIQCCLDGARLCMENTLGIAQLFIQFLLFTFIFVLYVIYFPPRRKINTFVVRWHLVCLPRRSLSWTISLLFSKIILGNFVISSTITAVFLAFVDESNDKHDASTLVWAGFLGVGSVLLAMIQYVPQIVETYLRKSVGALSIPMMMIHTPYAILITVSLALSPSTNWSTWLPYAFTAILQVVLLVMCLVYYFRAKKLGKSSFISTETTPLLRASQYSFTYDDDNDEYSDQDDQSILGSEEGRE